MYLYRNNEFEDIKADRQPIGKFIKREPFTTNIIELKEEGQMFLSTDGYLDQFGGQRGKKLKSRGFKEHRVESLQSDSPFNENLDLLFKVWAKNK